MVIFGAGTFFLLKIWWCVKNVVFLPIEIQSDMTNLKRNTTESYVAANRFHVRLSAHAAVLAVGAISYTGGGKSTPDGVVEDSDATSREASRALNNKMWNCFLGQSHHRISAHEGASCSLMG